jgi:hypothetical protein
LANDYDKDAAAAEAVMLERMLVRQLCIVGGAWCVPLYVATFEPTGEKLAVLSGMGTGRLVAAPYDLFDSGRLFNEKFPAQPGRHRDRQGDPGERFLHYKGGHYRWLGYCSHLKTGDRLVIYRSEERGTCWARTVEDWYAVVGPNGRERFTLVGYDDFKG